MRLPIRADSTLRLSFSNALQGQANRNMSSVRLSILISMYNEANSIKAVLDRVVTAPASFLEANRVLADLIIVDNGSQDKSSE